MQDSTKSAAKAPTPGRRLPTPPSDAACLLQLEERVRLLVGNAGDHALVQQLLSQAYQRALAEDFQSRLDDPAYNPRDRLLLMRDHQLIGQVQVTKRFGWFQGQRCSLATLQDFVTLPEYRAAEFDRPLLEVAESTALREGAILGVVRTDRPQWFEQRGWSCCRGQGHTQANTRAILSHLDAQLSKRRKRHARLEVRTWRHFELDKIQPLYGQLSPSMWGALERTDETWRWLVGRKAQDQILIAVERDRPELADRRSLATIRLDTGDQADHGNQFRIDGAKIIGYAVLRDSCVVEMLTLPGYSNARTMLVARACRDAIDRGHHFVSLHTPAADPMHELLVTAGGSWIGDGVLSGERWMLKLFAPGRWVELLFPVLCARARDAEISRPLNFVFAVGDSRLRLTLTHRSARWEPTTKSATPRLHCDRSTLHDLLTGNLSVAEALADGRLRTSESSRLQALATLFPPKMFWQSPFSLLRL